jgi:SAM-dependent methyltransferase
MKRFFSGDAAYYTALAERAKAQYNGAYADKYRCGDEGNVDFPTHADYGGLITQLTEAFNRAIDVLDLGCGTGRYFHHVRNPQTLTGVDVSPEMIKQAQHPVREAFVVVKPTLLCQSLTDIQFPAAAFDFIYSVGVLGEFMPFDAYVADRVRYWLKPGGQFLFTVVDADSSHWTTSWKRQLAMTAAPWLPRPIERRIRARVRFLALRPPELQAILAQFATVTIKPRVSCTSGRKHWVCVATKGGSIMETCELPPHEVMT